MSTQKPLLAKDIMATALITLAPEMDVYEAIDLLLRNRISGAPVIDAEGNLVGIFSEKDCMRILLDGALDGRPTATVGSLMQPEVYTITENVDLLSIAHVFVNRTYRRLPVVRDGKLVGQISRRDLLRAESKALRATPKARSSYLYLSAVSDRDDSPIR